MGNEKSVLSGLEIDEKPVEITDFWIHNTATIHGYNARKVSIFTSEPSLHYAASFGNPTPLEKSAKNLMLHRHPCILRYISSWSKGSKFFLTTEEARPLIQVLEVQNTLQICIGLYSILRALIFLHEKASATHNNVCSSSIYVTPEGCWKLGGLEYLCKFTELTPAYLQKIRTCRCERVIAPNEDATVLVAGKNHCAIDAYAFGVFAEDILKSKNSGDVPGLAEFRDFCKENLQNPDPHLRSNLPSILLHPFFTHDFLRIHAFLEELPLKNDTEKESFFESLVTQLKAFPENVVAEQLGRSLLSRIVLLDSTAQKKLLPFVLKPRDEKNDMDRSLFAVPTFKTYLVPKLLEMFCIRDASIRLVLLSHFNSFVYTFHTAELKTHVLPELLVGIKDTNDHLVCATLRALADIVPILGAATVIGGNRGKLFTDGRPNKLKDHKGIEGGSPSFSSIAGFDVPLQANASKVNLPERPSPDGGEDRQDTNFTFTEEECTWSDWDAQETSTEAQSHAIQNESKVQRLDEVDETSITDHPASTTARPESSAKAAGKSSETILPRRPTPPDISELDIKNSRSIDSRREEFDFFLDMEPVIKKTQVLHVEEEQTTKSIFEVKLSNNVIDGVEDTEENSGWGEDLNDWDVDESSDLKI